ncbi:MAG: hypothetical protein JWN14_2523, partial [Chthonomonadales bacterium]|nr:hypothetical protein [Chthonomonadales bacterium]
RGVGQASKAPTFRSTALYLALG